MYVKSDVIDHMTSHCLNEWADIVYYKIDWHKGILCLKYKFILTLSNWNWFHFFTSILRKQQYFIGYLKLNTNISSIKKNINEISQATWHQSINWYKLPWPFQLQKRKVLMVLTSTVQSASSYSCLQGFSKRYNDLDLWSWLT